MKGNTVKIKERPGMRKDRFSSLEYNFQICQDLSRKRRPRENTESLVKRLAIRQPKRFSMFAE